MNEQPDVKSGRPKWGFGNFVFGLLLGMAVQGVFFGVLVWVGVTRYQPYLEQLRREQRDLIARELDKALVPEVVTATTNRIDRILQMVDDGLRSVLRTEEKENMARFAMRAAEIALKSNDIVLAGIYVSQAAQLAPTNADNLLRYAGWMKEWYQQQRTEELRQAADPVIDEVIAFLRSRLALVDMSAIPRLLDEITWFVSQQNRRDAQPPSAVAEPALLEEAAVLLERQPTNTVQALREYEEELRSLADSVDALPPSPKLQDVRETLLERATEARQRADVLTVLSEVERLITAGEDAARSHRLRAACLARAEALLDELQMNADFAEGLHGNAVSALRKRIENAASNMDHAYNAAILDNINKVYERVQAYVSAVDTNTSCTPVIQKLGSALHEASTMAARLTESNAIQIATLKVTALSQALQRWQEAQQLRYNIWAAAKVRDFFTKYRDHLDLRTHEELIQQKLESELGPIDTRLLMSEALQAYNEVFQMFYGELYRKQKVELATRMVTTPKKPLSDF